MVDRQCAPARFTFLSGDTDPMAYGGKWVSQRLHNGEFAYWLVLEITNMEDAGCGEQGKYNVSVSAVSPSQAGVKNMRAAADYCGIAIDEVTSQEQWVELLHSYGVSAHLWDKSGNNYSKLMSEAKRWSRQEGSLLFGFVMDRPVNAIGMTGWEALQGNITAGLQRI